MNFKEFQHSIFPMRHRIYRLARWMMNHNEEAEDITQEVLLKLWSKKEELDQYNSVEALTMRITKNLCLDKLKLKINTSSVDIKDDLQDVSPSPEKQMEQTDTMDMLRVIISQLPEQQRLVMQLRSIEGYDTDEIMEITGMSRNNIRVALSRARKSIKESYVKETNYEKQYTRTAG